MVRGIANVDRISPKLRLPFLGINAVHDLRTTDRLHCAGCENVVLRNAGELWKRFGFQLLGTTPNLDIRIDGLASFLDRNPTHGVRPVRLFLAYGHRFDPNTPTQHLYAQGPNINTTWVEIVTLSGNAPPSFYDVGLEGRADGAIKAHSRAMYILDAGVRSYRISNEAPVNINKLGIAPATLLSLIQTSGSTGTEFGDQWSFNVTLANALHRLEDDTEGAAGLESNAIPDNVLGPTFADNNRGIICDVTVPNAAGVPTDFWTHIRLYGRNETLEQSGMRFMGQWHRDAAYALPDDIGILTDVGPGSGVFQFTAITADSFTQASGDGAWDYKPTRNKFPTLMKWFAVYQERGWWSDGSSLIYFTDPFNPAGGGHYEQLSGGYIVAGGNVELLVAFNEMLFIGHSSGYQILQGTFVSPTNRSVGAGAAVATISSTRLRDVEGFSVGPVAGGLGQHVQAGGLLYFVTRHGLECFDGLRVRNVSGAIRDVDGQPLGEILNRVYLVHDSVDQIIFMMVRVDSPSETPNAAAFGGTSQIWAYHYGILDPVMSQQMGYPVGSWTNWKLIRGDQEYTAIGPYIGGSGERTRLMVGHRFSKQVLVSSDASKSMVLVQDESVEDDYIGVDEPRAGVTWAWQSVRMNKGVFERKMLWSHLHLTLAGSGNIAAGANVDGADAALTSKAVVIADNVVLGVGLYGKDINVLLGATAAATRHRVIAMGIETEGMAVGV